MLSTGTMTSGTHGVTLKTGLAFLFGDGLIRGLNHTNQVESENR